MEMTKWGAYIVIYALKSLIFSSQTNCFAQEQTIYYYLSLEKVEQKIT